MVFDMKYGMIVFIFLLTACETTEYVTVERVRMDTLHHNTVQRDSIHVHDSVVVRQYIQGDTVHDVKEVWRDRWRERTVHDTVMHATHDTIPQPYPVEKIVEVEKEMSWWQSALMIAGALAVALLLLFVGGVVSHMVRGGR